MPYFDGTGPMGQGPMTGRQMGIAGGFTDWLANLAEGYNLTAVIDTYYELANKYGEDPKEFLNLDAVLKAIRLDVHDFLKQVALTPFSPNTISEIDKLKTYTGSAGNSDNIKAQKDKLQTMYASAWEELNNRFVSWSGYNETLGEVAKAKEEYAKGPGTVDPEYAAYVEHLQGGGGAEQPNGGVYAGDKEKKKSYAAASMIGKGMAVAAIVALGYVGYRKWAGSKEEKEEDAYEEA